MNKRPWQGVRSANRFFLSESMNSARRFSSAAFLCVIGLLPMELPMGLLASTCGEGEIVTCQEEAVESLTCRSMAGRARIRTSSLKKKFGAATKIKAHLPEPLLGSNEHSFRNGFGGHLNC